MKRLSQRHLRLKRLSSRAKPDTDTLICEMRNTIKHDPEVRKKFDEYGVPINHIDKVPICFCELDVSAKTKDKRIYLNEAMLDDNSPVDDPTHYLVHEIVHYLQQLTGKNMEKHRTKNINYLDKETEEEAFKTQVDFKKREESEEEAKDYVENLLDHHNLKGKDREKKKEELLDEDGS